MIGFAQLFEEAGVLPDAIDGDTSVSTLVMDSRKAVPGCCFVCMPSESTDSHTFLNAAKEAGAVAAIVHSQPGFDQARSLGLAVAYVEPSTSGELPDPSTETPEQRIRRTTGHFSEALWRVAKVAFGDPSSKLQVIGVTGTNGKTTTAWLIRDMLNLLGVPCAYIGTLGFGLPMVDPGLGIVEEGEPSETQDGPTTFREELRPLANTTPFTVELNAMLAEAIERGCQAVAMEVSSHALAERRADGIEFDVAVFTNLTQDHLDYHGTMEAYRFAKERLFDSGLPRAAINVGDSEGARLASRLGARAIRFLEVPKLTSFGDVDSRTEVEGCAFSIGISQIHLVLQSHVDGDVGFIANLGGGYNVENLIAAVTAVSAVGVPLGKIAEAITTQLRPVPGRFEPVPNDSGIGIIVDYAHTPDALEKLLATVRPLTQGKVITVFGCGGDRDKSKRPLMARAAEQGSDIVIVTSDNPRTEDPMAIIGDILMGIVDCGLSIGEPLDFPIRNPQATIHIHPDRPAAVALAVELAEPGDAVVIAGKGHENYQIIGRTKHDMDDRELARQGLLKRRLG